MMESHPVNFDQVVNRWQQHSVKYDEMEQKFHRTDLIPMWIADMEFRVAEPIIEALQAKLDHGIFGYTSRPDSYFESFAEWQKARNNWTVRPEQMSFCLGIVPALCACVDLFTQPNDRVMFFSPVYSEFFSAVTNFGRQVLAVPLHENQLNYTIDWEATEQALDQKPAMVIMCNPHNPVGRVWSPEELSRLATACHDRGILLVSDEIHSDLIMPGHHHTPLAKASPETSHNLITMLSATKTFNLAGLQAGTVVFGDPDRKEQYDSYWKNLDITRNNAFSIVAVEAAFRQGADWLEQALKYIQGNFELIDSYLKQHLPMIKFRLPDCTYLAWLDFRELGLSGDELADFVVTKAGLALNDGRSYGLTGEGFLRLNAACPRSTIQQALDQLKQAIDNHC